MTYSIKKPSPNRAKLWWYGTPQTFATIKQTNMAIAESETNNETRLGKATSSKVSPDERSVAETLTSVLTADETLLVEAASQKKSKKKGKKDKEKKKGREKKKKDKSSGKDETDISQLPVEKNEIETNEGKMADSKHSKKKKKKADKKKKTKTTKEKKIKGEEVVVDVETPETPVELEVDTARDLELQHVAEIEAAMSKSSQKSDGDDSMKAQVQDNWATPRLPRGRLRRRDGEIVPSYLPPGRGMGGHHPDPALYVQGYGSLGDGYYSLQTRDAYEILIKHLRKAGALVQMEIDWYDCNNCFLRVGFKSRKTKEEEKEVFRMLRHDIHVLTCLLLVRYKARGPLTEIAEDALLLFDVEPDEELKMGYTVAQAVNQSEDVVKATRRILRILQE